MKVGRTQPGPMFVGNFLHHCQAQTRASCLGRHIRLEGTFENFLGKTGAIVDDRQAHRQQFAVLAARDAGAQLHLAVRPIAHGVEPVLHQVVDDLAQLGGVAQDAG